MKFAHKITKNNMYKKGDIEVGELRWAYDNRYDEDAPAKHPYEDKPVIKLPHSCDEWIIGGELEARVMINDLEAAITKLRAQDNQN